MIDTVLMENYIRETNPVRIDDVDADELAHFIAVARARRATAADIEADTRAQKPLRVALPTPRRRAWAFAVGFFIVLVAIASAALVLRGENAGVFTDTPPTSIPQTTVPVTVPAPADPTTTSPASTTTLGLGSDVLTLRRVGGLDPVLLSTAIGDIEFTTWALPDTWDGLWWAGETEHGVVATPYLPYSEPSLVWSPDGISWTDMVVSVAPDSWSTSGDRMTIFGDGGSARLRWMGTYWAEVDSVSDLGLRAGAAGPSVTVGVAGSKLYYSTDGSEFVEAAAPPDPNLYPEPSAGCSPPGLVGEGARALGPIVATHDGFVALAARSSADWSNDPVCEPLVWVSRDGNTWTPTSEESPFGERAFVHDLAAVGNRVVAIGGVSRTTAAVWVSDDATTWQRAQIDAGELWQVAGGARGWVLMGHWGGRDVGNVWFSADGVTWDGPYERPPGWGDRAGLYFSVAMLDDRIIGTGKQFDFPGMAMDSAPPRVVVGVFIDDRAQGKEEGG